MFCGPVEMQGVAEWIVSEKKQFRLWIQTSVNAWMYDIATTTLRVRLAPRHLRAHWEVHVDRRALSVEFDLCGDWHVLGVSGAQKMDEGVTRLARDRGSSLRCQM